MAIWLCHSDEEALDSCEALREELTHRGIAVVDFDPAFPGDSGVFVSSGSGVMHFLSSLPRIGGLRIVVALVGDDVPSIDEIREWVDHGVVDVVCCGPEATAEAICARLERRRNIEEAMSLPLVRKNLVGVSTVWRETLAALIEIALYSDKFVLVTGESGTGKELAARLIHSLDPKMRAKEMVVVDCTTIIPSLSGSELFGHTENAFTGATRARKGAFELADQSTLFLDEIGELPLELQAGLLRVIQEKSFKRVGSNTWQKTAFRLVAATNRDLETEVREERFRRDLFHRISAWHCAMPPLRKRREDILPLAEFFLRKHTSEDGPRTFDPFVASVLMSRGYEGNVRELQNLVLRLIGRHVGGGTISIGDLPIEDWPLVGTVRKVDERRRMEAALSALIDEGMGMQEIGEITSELLTHIAYKRSDGNIARAAKLLKVTPRALQQRRKRTRDSAAKR
jgi:transcriptional regulator with GAF, ATPase, and Fis domain